MTAMTALLLLLTLAAPIVYISPRWLGARGPFWLTLTALTAGLAPWGMLVAAGPTVWNFQAIAYTVDGITLLVSGLVLVLGIAVTAASGITLPEDDSTPIYYALLLLMLAFIIGLAHAADLFNLWLWFEAMAVASTMLVAHYRSEHTALEATFKYLVQSATGSALILAALAVVLASTGTMTISEIQAAGVGSASMVLAGALFLIGFGVKAALVPLHTWLPDAHSQAPSGISALLSAVVIEGGLIALLRVLSTLTAGAETFGVLLLAFAALNIVVGNMLALRQTQVKRLLAYSSVAHMGYMVFGLGIALATGNTGGAEGSLFHLVSHGLMKGLAFLSVGALLYVLVTVHGRHDPLTIDDLSGAGGRYPIASLTLTVALLGLGGLPPLVGFMSKWQIFQSGVATQSPLIIALVVVAAFNSVLSLAYYAPLINRLYRRKPSQAVAAGAPAPLPLAAPVSGLALAVLVLGVWPGLLDSLIQLAGGAVLAGFGL